MKIILLALAVLISSSVQAQKIFTEKDLVAVVKNFHPIAKQALLSVKISDANLTASKGVFDPVIGIDNSRKAFDGITYYNHQWTELKIPAWYGIDLYTGRETVRGDRLNPEETKGTISYVGVSLPLIQNIIIDKRRAAIKDARILNQQSEIVRMAAINDLVAEALLAYWNWWEQYRLLQVVQASLQNAKARLAMVNTMHRLGDRPAIDTLEAATQVQLFEQQETEAAMLLQKSRLQLSLFLWSNKEVAYELPEDATPQTLQAENTLEIQSLLSNAGMHPQLLEYDYKLRRLNIEKQLKMQSLLPEVTAKYNALSRDFSKTFNEGFFNNNYRFGLTLSMPLRLSRSRGEFRAAKLKIEQVRVEQVAKQVTIQNKVKQFYTGWQQTIVQHQQQQRLALSYAALQRGEETKFKNGESSLFLVNAREAKTIEAHRKELALAAKIQQTAVQLRWAAGLFSNF